MKKTLTSIALAAGLTLFSGSALAAKRHQDVVTQANKARPVAVDEKVYRAFMDVVWAGTDYLETPKDLQGMPWCESCAPKYFRVDEGGEGGGFYGATLYIPSLDKTFCVYPPFQGSDLEWQGVARNGYHGRNGERVGADRDATLLVFEGNQVQMIDDILANDPSDTGHDRFDIRFSLMPGYRWTDYVPETSYKVRLLKLRCSAVFVDRLNLGIDFKEMRNPDYRDDSGLEKYIGDAVRIGDVTYTKDARPENPATVEAINEGYIAALGNIKDELVRGKAERIANLRTEKERQQRAHKAGLERETRETKRHLGLGGKRRK